MGRKTKGEQEFIDNLVQRLGDQYQGYERNIEYRNDKCGELDLLCHRWDKGYDLYEVKSTRKNTSIAKAEEQLTRARSHSNRHIEDTFIYIGRTDEIIPHKKGGR